MSGILVIAIGLIFCLAGVRFLRIAIVAAGFATGWLIADALDTTTVTTFLVGLGSAIAALVLSILLKKFVFMIAGAVIGAAVGAKLFSVLSFGVDAPALSVLIVVLTAAVCGYLAQRGSRRVLMWGTAFGGAALVLSGIGMVAPKTLGNLNHPQEVGGSAVLTIVWVALAVFSWRFQARADESR